MASGDPSGTLAAIARVAEEAAYGRNEPPPEVRSQLDATLRAWRLRRFKAKPEHSSQGGKGDGPGEGAGEGTAGVNQRAAREPDRTSPLR